MAPPVYNPVFVCLGTELSNEGLGDCDPGRPTAADLYEVTVNKGPTTSTRRHLNLHCLDVLDRINYTILELSKVYYSATTKLYNWLFGPIIVKIVLGGHLVILATVTGFSEKRLDTCDLIEERTYICKFLLTLIYKCSAYINCIVSHFDLI